MIHKIARKLVINLGWNVASKAVANEFQVTPKDYLVQILRSHGIKANVAMHYINETTPILYVLSKTALNSDRMMTIEEQLITHISDDMECHVPKHVFWKFNVDQH